jgi:enoyl-[acyl-carrier protein] reductase II
MKKNRVTDMLGIKYPLVQGALGGVSESSEFVAAVCNAGALGILAAVHMGLEAVRESIYTIRKLTDKPFGINILNVNPEYEKILEVMVEENVPVFSHGRYNPVKALMKAKESNKSLSMPTVGSVKHAVQAEQDGADAIIVTGTEGGGHTGYVGTIVLVPAVVKKVKIPVIAGGGIATPEQIAAMFVLGAEGVIMGTRFMMTKESPIHPNAKKFLLNATEEDTYATLHVSGRHQRWVVNPALRKFMGLAEVKGEDHYWTFPHVAGKAAIEGDMEKGIVSAGQGIGLIDDIPSIKEMVESLMAGAEKVLREKAQSII